MKYTIVTLLICFISLSAFCQGDVIGFMSGASCVTPAAITGTFSVCGGASTTLHSATGGGIWSSSNPAVASIGSTTGVTVGGNQSSISTTTISYTVSGGCFVTQSFTDNPLPATIVPLTPVTVCQGNTVTYSNTSGGGTWTSSNTAVATIDASSGVATGISGTASYTITYTLAGGCFKSKTTNTVHATPANATGNSPVCVGNTISLAASEGGTWSSSNPAIATIVTGSGLVTGVSQGNCTMTFISTTGSCVNANTIVTVNPLPASITGTTSVNVGNSTQLSDVSVGGTWASSNTARATVDGTGRVFGVSAGTCTISYTLPTSCYTTVTVTVSSISIMIAFSLLIIKKIDS